MIYSFTSEKYHCKHKNKTSDNIDFERILSDGILLPPFFNSFKFDCPRIRVHNRLRRIFLWLTISVVLLYGKDGHIS